MSIRLGNMTGSSTLARMSWQWWSAVLGLVFVAAGAALAFIGFRRTWGDFVSSEKFSRALIRWLPAGWNRGRGALSAAYNLVVHRKRYIQDGDRVTSVSAQAVSSFNSLPLEFPQNNLGSAELLPPSDRKIGG